MGHIVDPRFKDKKKAEYRRVVVSDCLLKGFTVRQTAEVCMEKLGLDKLPSPAMIQRDRDWLLKEWQGERMANMEDHVTLELARIDAVIKELHEAWEKSKEDVQLKFSKKKGEKIIDRGNRKFKIDKEDPGNSNKIEPTSIEQGTREVINYGDPRFISEIRYWLAERRKLLGLYAPEKNELTGKDGKDLIPTQIADLSDLSSEDKAILLKIARKLERTE